MFCDSILYAQDGVHSAGAQIAGSGGSVAYSVGQIICTTITGTQASVAHGVQQPFEISVITDAEDYLHPELILSIHPNPFSETLVLQTDAAPGKKYMARLCDFNGRLLFEAEINQTETILHLSTLAPAIYFLHIYASDQSLKSFKIIKN